MTCGFYQTNKEEKKTRFLLYLPIDAGTMWRKVHWTSRSSSAGDCRLVTPMWDPATRMSNFNCCRISITKLRPEFYAAPLTRSTMKTLPSTASERTNLRHVHTASKTSLQVFRNQFLQLQSLTLHFVVLSFDRYSRDDVIGEVLLPVSEALTEMTPTAGTMNKGETTGVVETAGGITLFRDIAPRSHKVSYSTLPLPLGWCQPNLFSLKTRRRLTDEVNC